MDRRLELSLLATVAGGVVSLVIGAFEWLKSLVNPGLTPGILVFSLAVAVLLFTGVAVALVFALAARLISIASGLQQGFWHESGLFLQDFALWLTMWTVFWGVPFASAMVLSGVLTRYLLTVPAVAIGTTVGLLLLLVMKRYFSPQTWAVLAHFWPARRIGSFWMIVGILLIILPGRFLLDRCYVFEVTGASGLRSRSEVAAIEVRLSGRVINHAALRAQVSLAHPLNAPPTSVLRFDVAEPGTYITWLKLSTLKPGVYRVRIFFDTSGAKGFAASLARRPSIFAPPERQFLMRVE